MVAGVIDQPLVEDFVLKYAEEHSSDRNGATTPGDHAPRAERKDAVRPTSITESVLDILPSISREFIYEDVIERVINDGYEFEAKDRRTAIGRVLRKLCDHGTIVEVKKGKAGAANVYKRV